MDYQLRAATPEDAGEMARLFTELGHPTTGPEVAGRWRAWAAAGDSAIVAVAPDGRLLGVATLHRRVPLHHARVMGRISSLVVDAAARGTGIGRALVEASEAGLAAAGCTEIELTSHMRRADAHAFYLHLGYERSSARFVKRLAPANPPGGLP